MDKKSSELLKKLNSLRDLRDAINVVKSDAKIEKADKPHLSIVKPQESKPAQSAEPKDGGLRHLGIKSTVSGIKTHMIGIGGMAPHYEMDIHAEAFKNKQPSISVSHIGPSGSILKRSPKMYSDTGEAIKAIVSHHNSKKWE